MNYVRPCLWHASWVISWRLFMYFAQWTCGLLLEQGVIYNKFSVNMCIVISSSVLFFLQTWPPSLYTKTDRVSWYNRHKNKLILRFNREQKCQITWATVLQSYNNDLNLDEKIFLTVTKLIPIKQLYKAKETLESRISWCSSHRKWKLSVQDKNCF